jgi:polygalacturonase
MVRCQFTPVTNLFRSVCVALAWNLSQAIPFPLFGEQTTTPPSFNVKDFGAVGDGKTKDTAAFQKAIDTCAQAGGGDVTFPAGTYLTGSIELKSHVHLVMPAGTIIQGSGDKADYQLATARWEGMEKPAYLALIRADHAEDIAVTGCGIIRGNQEIGKLRNPRGPTLIEPIECKSVRLDGMTLHGNQMWTVHPTYCQDVALSNLVIQTTGWNSDGIDPDSCQRVTIDHCSFETGDDNIAIKSGKGQEGVTVGRPSEDITITNCNFINGTCSIAFGSELSGGIQNVHIQHCTFRKGRVALYLKSRPGRAGYIRNVTAEDLDVGPEPLLEIITNYQANPDAQGVAGPEGLTKFQDIVINDVRIQGRQAVRVEATAENPAAGITLSQITGTCAQPWIFKNATNVTLKDIHVTGFEKNFLSLDHASGTGLDENNH